MFCCCVLVQAAITTWNMMRKLQFPATIHTYTALITAAMAGGKNDFAFEIFNR